MRPGVMERPEGPWKGLVPYFEKDYPYFFGRARERRTIVANLKSSATTVLYGPSGVGKSSLLLAGVVHDLKEAAERNREERGRIGYMPVIFRQWQGDFQEGLREELVSRATFFEAPPTADSEDFRTLCRNWLDADHGLLLLVLDQFEEFFLYHPSPEEWLAFGKMLADLLSGGVRILFSLREDHLSAMERLQSSLPDLFANQLRIEHLTDKAAQEAISGPVVEWNKRHETTYTLEPELVAEVIRQLKPEYARVPGLMAPGSAAAQIQAPWLQIVMSRIWQDELAAKSSTLRLTTLKKLQGVVRIAENHLSDEMRGLSLPERMTATGIFSHLVTPSGSKILYPESGLVQTTTAPLRKYVIPLLDKLTGEGRILERIEAADGMRYQIYHDLLGPAIIAWSSHFSRKGLIAIAAAVCLLVLAVTGTWATSRSMLATKEIQDTTTAATALSSLAIGKELPLNVRQSLACYSWLQSENDVLKKRAALNIQELFPVDVKDLSMPGILNVAMSQNTKYIAVSGQSGNVWLIRRRVQNDREGAYAIRLLPGHQNPVVALAFSSIYLATGDSAGLVRVYDPNSGKLLKSWKAHEGSVNAAALNNNEDTLATAGDDGLVQIWKVSGAQSGGTAGQLIQTLKGHAGPVIAVDFQRDQPRVASAGKDGTLRVWVYKPADRGRIFKQPNIRDLRISVHGTRVAAGTTEGVSLIDLGTYQETPVPVSGVVQSLSWDEGSNLAIAFRSGEIAVWQQSTMAIGPRTRLAFPLSSVAMASGGGRIVVGSSTGVLEVLDARLREMGQLRIANLEVAPKAGENGVISVSDRESGVTGVWDVLHNRLALRLQREEADRSDPTALLSDLFPGEALPKEDAPRVEIRNGRVSIYATTTQEAIAIAKAAAPYLPKLTDQQCKEYLGTSPCPPLDWR